MKMLVFVFVLLGVAVNNVDSQVYGMGIHISAFDCTGKADAVAEIGCDGYLECVSEQVVKHFCTKYQFFDRDSLTCHNTTTGGSGCTTYNVCENRPNGRYPDPQQSCQTYYTCHEQNFYGHQYCPGGLVFHEDLQICNWPSNVPFPCGTKQIVG